MTATSNPPAHRGLRDFGVALLVLGGGLISGCTDPTPRPDFSGSIDRIFLVTVDTLRADHLGCYGYPFATSPFLDGLAARGIVFDNAHAPMATTAPSHASLFTGLYPIQHRVLKNGHKLPQAAFTLAEFFHDSGFQTAAVVSTDQHFLAGELDQGFSTFREPRAKAKKSYRRAKRTIDDAIKVLEEIRSDQPLFFWLHLFDPHVPYRTKARRTSKGPPDGAQRSLAEFLVQDHHADLATFGESERSLLKLVRAYDREIRYTDRSLKRFFAAVDDQGLGDKALWIVASDHGEGLGGHSSLGHGVNLYYELIRVPLIFFSTAEAIQGGRRIGDLVELVDVFPTLIDLFGGDLAQFQETPGTSLVPFLLDEPLPKARDNRVAFAQRRLFATGSDLHKRQASHGLPPELIEGQLYSVHDPTFKYHYWDTGHRELYSTEDDPYEVHDLSAVLPKETRRMHRELTEKLRQFEEYSKIDPQPVDPETLKDLEALGYIQ